MKTIKLTPRQMEVLKWLAGGWEARVYTGAAVHINGKRVCNIDTMTVLERLGFVWQPEKWAWKITAEGSYYHAHNT